MNRNVFPGLTVWDVHKNGNVFLGLTVCDIHIENVFWDSSCGMYIPTEMISEFTVWDVHIYGNDWVSMPRPIAHGLSPGPTRAIPDDFWVVWEGPPIAHTHLATVPNAVAERGFKLFV